jgi:DNA-binding response OmpR family regulator
LTPYDDPTQANRKYGSVSAVGNISARSHEVLAGMDILVIEDDAIMREALSEWLDSAGFQVRTAEDGNAGLAQIKASVPKLVVTDLYMPGVSGTVVIAELRQHFPDVAIIAISGLFTSGYGIDAAAAVALGADRALAKPFSRAEFLAAVTAVLSPLPP